MSPAGNFCWVIDDAALHNARFCTSTTNSRSFQIESAEIIPIGSSGCGYLLPLLDNRRCRSSRILPPICPFRNRAPECCIYQVRIDYLVRPAIDAALMYCNGKRNPLPPDQCSHPTVWTKVVRHQSVQISTGQDRPPTASSRDDARHTHCLRRQPGCLARHPEQAGPASSDFRRRRTR